MDNRDHKTISSVACLRECVREILLEEIGRNYKTLDNDPYSWEDFPDIYVNIYPMTDGGLWAAQVDVGFDDSLSTPLRTFASEADAQSFARSKAEEANRTRMNSGIHTGTPDMWHKDYIDGSVWSTVSKPAK